MSGGQKRAGALVGPHVLVLKEKHSTRYLLVRTLEALERAAQRVIRERLAENWYEDSPAEPAPCVHLEGCRAQTGLTDARRAVDVPKAALAFLRRRSREEYEYEGIDVEPIEEVE